MLFTLMELCEYQPGAEQTYPDAWNPHHKVPGDTVSGCARRLFKRLQQLATTFCRA